MSAPVASIEAEQSVLGALLVDNSAWDRVSDLLKADDFYRSEHKLIYSAIGSMVNAMKPADVVTVYEALAGGDEFGGLAYLNQLAQSVTGSHHSRRHAEIVRERSILRDLLAKIGEASDLARTTIPLPEKLDKVSAIFAGLDQSNSSKKPRAMSDVIVKVIDAINEAAEGKQAGWKTGIPGLDFRLNGGLQPGKLIILAARPSVGKTSLSVQIAKQIASRGHPALVLSQEMEAEELGERALANEARVDYGNIQTGKLIEEEWNRLAEGVDALGNIPLWIDDEPALTLRAINSKARSIKRLTLLVVDYIQLSEGEGDTRSAQVGSISRGLKKLAKQLGVVVIALSQLNREVDKRPGRRPQMSDLRDSGEIEQDADTILFLWPMSEAEDGVAIRHVGLDVAKNRKGKKGAFVLTFDGAKQFWGESTKSIDEFSASKSRSSSFE